MKILIVDDNEQARRMIRNCLGHFPHSFHECADGADVLTAYTYFLPDWVLMDWEMKLVNGLTATRLLLEIFPEAKVVMVSNHDERTLREAALAVGAVDFVLKDELVRLQSVFADRGR